MELLKWKRIRMYQKLLDARIKGRKVTDQAGIVNLGMKCVVLINMKL